MAPRVDPVASDESLPSRADVVIIGGGIIGTVPCRMIDCALRSDPLI